MDCLKSLHAVNYILYIIKGCMIKLYYVALHNALVITSKLGKNEVAVV